MAKFCSRCGNPLPEDGSPCPNCAVTAQQPAATAFYQGSPAQSSAVPPAQPYTPQATQHSTSGPFASDLSSTIKTFFSGNPTRVLDVAAASVSHMWAVWGGAYTLLYALAVTLMPGQAIKTILGYLLGSALDPAGKLFGYGLLLAALTFILWAASLRAVCALSKASVHFVKVLNLTAIALLPTTVSLVAGILLGFIYFPLGIFLVIVGSAAGLVLLYSGLQKLVIFQGPPFWLFVVAYAVVTLVILLVAARIVAPSLINSALNYASALF